MVFITVGSQKFQFNRLLREVDSLVKQGIIRDALAQIGYSTYVPTALEVRRFMDRVQFMAAIESHDVVITHGGTGVIASAVKCHKRVIAVPRLSQYGEHVDDHQVEVVDQFASTNMILRCDRIEELGAVYLGCLARSAPTYSSNSNAFVADLDRYLCGDDRLSDHG